MSPLFKRSSAPEDRWVILGLGNPGEKYAETRHNAGAMVIDVLLGRVGGKLKSHKSGCLVAEGHLAGTKVTLARSTGYMNNSGGPARSLMDFYKAPVGRLIVVHDELDIPFGDIRTKTGGGTAGHNGLKSLASHIGKDFHRVRFGVGRPRGDADAAGWVLQRFSTSERKELPVLLEQAADEVESLLD